MSLIPEIHRRGLVTLLAVVVVVSGMLLIRGSLRRAPQVVMGGEGGSEASVPEARRGHGRARPKPLENGSIEVLGTGMETPEQFLNAVFQTLAEPFSEDVLERLSRVFLESRNPEERLRIAAVLHRYGKAQGTDYLLAVGRGASDGADIALTVLALSKIPEALECVVRWIERGEPGAEFLAAIGEWVDPTITAALAKRSEVENHRNIILAKALAQHGIFEAYQRATVDRPAGPIPAIEAEAMAARMQSLSDGGLVGRVSQWARASVGLDAAAVMEITRLAGERAARSGVEQFLGEYSKELSQWNREYAEFIRDLRSGAREWKPVMFDGVRFESAVGLASLLGEWGTNPVSAEAVYGLMDSYLQGRRTPAALETLAVALVRLDPSGSEERLLGMGMDPEALRASQALSSLRPLPQRYIPEQVTKRVPEKIPGEE